MDRASGAGDSSARSRSAPHCAQRDRPEKVESGIAALGATAHGIRHLDDHRIRGGGDFQMVDALVAVDAVAREQIRDRVGEIERQLDQNLYRRGPWNKLLKDARALPRE